MTLRPFIAARNPWKYRGSGTSLRQTETFRTTTGRLCSRISQLTDAQKAREWWYRKQGQPDTPQRIEIRRAVKAAFPTALASPSHSKPAVSQVNRDDMYCMFVGGNTMSPVAPDETDDSIFGKKLKADLRTRYDRACGPAERTPTEPVPRPKLRGSYSTMDLNSSARMRCGPASRQPEVHHVYRQPTQQSRRGETGTYASNSQAHRDGRNKPLPKLPTDTEPTFECPRLHQALIRRPRSIDYSKNREGREHSEIQASRRAEAELAGPVQYVLPEVAMTEPFTKLPSSDNEKRIMSNLATLNGAIYSLISASALLQGYPRHEQEIQARPRNPIAGQRGRGAQIEIFGFAQLENKEVMDTPEWIHAVNGDVEYTALSLSTVTSGVLFPATNEAITRNPTPLEVACPIAKAADILTIVIRVWIGERRQHFFPTRSMSDSTKAVPGLLFVYGECGEHVTEKDFNG
ncbi:hypothetical protein IMY05_C4417000700 [Salix suchowensis]|nr:hypothetical protein IMY05_C4417000700 [Salix suchowensis]